MSTRVVILAEPEDDDSGSQRKPTRPRVTPDKLELKEPVVVFTEGADDASVVERLLEKANEPNVLVLDCGSRSNIPRYLKIVSAGSAFADVVQIIGVLADADADYASAEQSIQTALRSAGLTVPASAQQRTDTIPSVAYAILPGENQQGSLETVCLESVDGDPAMECVSRYFECLSERNIGYDTVHELKCRIQVFLASRPKRKHSIGHAIGMDYFPIDDDAFNDLRHFLDLLLD